jgi:uncharacterized membrane protein YoaK (UPF0700 family)
MSYYPKAENPEEFSRSEIRRMYYIGAIMSAIAGYINSAVLLEYAIPVSQMSGVGSHLSTGLFEIDAGFIFVSIAVLVGFIFGAFISGVLIGDKNYRETPNYAYGLTLNGILIMVAGLLNPLHSFFTVTLAAIACGLQNALVASYKGMQLRTTHMTGNATDLGVHLARKYRTGKEFNWQTPLLIVLLIFYVVGGVIGILFYQVSPVISLGFTGILTFIVGLVWLRRYYKRHHNKQLKKPQLQQQES